MDSLFAMFDQFMRAHIPQFSQQQHVIENWDQFLQLLQTQPLDYGRIYTIINKLNIDHERQSSTQRTRNLTAASSPRIVSSVQKNSTNVLQKFSQLENASSPKIAISNLASQQQLQKQKYQVNEEFNRHLLLSKTKELLFNFQVSSDKLSAMARLQQGNQSKSPIKYQISYQKQRGSNHSAEHYKI